MHPILIFHEYTQPRLNVVLKKVYIQYLELYTSVK